MERRRCGIYHHRNKKCQRSESGRYDYAELQSRSPNDPGFSGSKAHGIRRNFSRTTEDFEELRECMDKLQLNDASLTYELETSQALGFGFRCGFLGMLHMEIIQERLEREFNQTVITTVPNVSFIAHSTKGETITVNNPSEMPDPTRTDRIEEPYINAQIITKPEYIGNIITLCLGKSGILLNQNYLTPTRVELHFEMPLTEIVFDFYDKLKSQTRGYASFDYHPIGYRDADIAKMDILLNGEKVDALSALIHRSRAAGFRTQTLRKTERTFTTSAISDCHTGSHRFQSDCPGNHQRFAERCYSKMLWRRHLT